MKVGVISDTHDRLPTFRQALAMFKRLKVGAILHAGDLVAPFAAKLLNDPDLRMTSVAPTSDGFVVALERIYDKLDKKRAQKGAK